VAEYREEFVTLAQQIKALQEQYTYRAVVNGEADLMLLLSLDGPAISNAESDDKLEDVVGMSGWDVIFSLASSTVRGICCIQRVANHYEQVMIEHHKSSNKAQQQSFQVRKVSYHVFLISIVYLLSAAKQTEKKAKTSPTVSVMFLNQSNRTLPWAGTMKKIEEARGVGRPLFIRNDHQLPNLFLYPFLLSS
jgi:hypothetical protein